MPESQVEVVGPDFPFLVKPTNRAMATARPSPVSRTLAAISSRPPDSPLPGTSAST